MKSIAFFAVAAALGLGMAPLATAQGSAFAYQGQLLRNGAPATGTFDIRASIFGIEGGGVPIGPTVTNLAIKVSNGVFTTRFDFGAAVFSGGDRWLDLAVRPSGSVEFTPLTPRQAILPTPYSIFAMTPAGPEGPPGPAGPPGSSGTGTGWALDGNAGTTPETHFIGTTDASPLVLRAANQPVLRLEAQASGTRIIGGRSTSIDPGSTNSAVLSGRDNSIAAAAHESVIAGGLDNIIARDQRSAFIGGGARNEILQDNQHAVIVGGRDNRIGTNVVISLVVGGGENRIANNVDGGVMIGGFRNDVLGSNNPDRREIAPILIGGSDNEIARESNWAIILGGDNNRIGTNSASAIIVGGTNNLVAANAGHSFAAGRRTRANHQGVFIWADSQNASFASAGVNTFNVRAEGGVHWSEDTSMFFGSSVRQMINLWSDAYGIGVQSSTLYFRTDDFGSFSWFRGGTHSNNANSPGVGGTELMRLNSGGLRVNGTLVSASDRELKENFRDLDPREVLDKVASLPIREWNYKQDPGTRHVGPTAQDFHAAFGVGPDDRHIATVDADGVALAAIQGLQKKLADQEEALRDRDARLSRLESELNELRGLLRHLASPPPTR